VRQCVVVALPLVEVCLVESAVGDILVTKPLVEGKISIVSTEDIIVTTAPHKDIIATAVLVDEAAVVHVPVSEKKRAITLPVVVQPLTKKLKVNPVSTESADGVKGNEHIPDKDVECLIGLNTSSQPAAKEAATAVLYVDCS